jgi:RNA polymerase sigma factor (sigma-70 family)
VTSPEDEHTEDLLRELAPQVLGALVRRYGHFDVAEDAVQESLLAAVTQWPVEGRPDSPKGWLIRVASRRMTDLLRTEQARQRRENTVAERVLPEDYLAPAADVATTSDHDDSLVLLLMCCHPALTTTSQIALTLRAVGGLTTGEIARAFLVPESTMGQRISRAKQSVRDAGARFKMPPPSEFEGRLAAVLHVLDLIFNEGYTASSGPYLVRHDLALEAIRLARLVHRVMPEDGEVAGLLALMLLTDARRPARTRPDGELVPLPEQDRSLWDRAAITEGVSLVSDARSRSPLGPYQVQAAIAAVHDEAVDSDATDWTQVLALYGVLARMSDNPMVRLNQAVAAAMVHGPATGLRLLEGLDDDPRMKGTHRVDAVRAHLLERAGQHEAAVERYRAAARRTTSAPERRYLEKQAARLTPGESERG